MSVKNDIIAEEIERLEANPAAEVSDAAKEEEHIARMSAATQQLSDCIVGLGIPSAAIIDVMSVVLAEVIARTAKDKDAVYPILSFVNNRINQMIAAFEEAGLPAWTRKPDA